MIVLAADHGGYLLKEEVKKQKKTDTKWCFAVDVDVFNYRKNF